MTDAKNKIEPLIEQLSVKRNIPFEIEFHKNSLNTLRKKLKASNVCYIQRKDTYFLRVIKNGSEIVMKLNGEPRDVTPEVYKQLVKDIGNEFLKIKEDGQNKDSL